jgi:hypothetical protein
LVFGIEGYPLNNISSSNIPSAQAVRSDAWLYKKEKVNLGMLLYEQIEKFPWQVYGRIAGGFLEVQYGGLDAELAMPLLDGRLMVGVSGSVVKKREVDKLLQFKEKDWQDYYRTAFVNTRLNLPEMETAIDLKTGRFLAGDVGTRVTVSNPFAMGSCFPPGGASRTPASFRTRTTGIPRQGRGHLHPPADLQGYGFAHGLFLRLLPLDPGRGPGRGALYGSFRLYRPKHEAFPPEGRGRSGEPSVGFLSPRERPGA